MQNIGEILKELQRPQTSKRVLPDPSVEPPCKICGGAHWIHPVIDGKVDYSQVVRCECMKEHDRQQRWQKMLKYCNLPEGANEYTFESFDTRRNKSLIEAKRVAMEIAQGVGDFRWLTLIGMTDRGKSHLSKAVCQGWLSRGVPARYAFVPDLLRELKEGFDLEDENSFRVRFNLLLNVPLLALDDLGSEKITTWGIETLQAIINHRYENRLHLIVTTNRNLDEIAGDNTKDAQIASQRIASRLRRERWAKVIVIDVAEYNGGRR